MFDISFSELLLTVVVAVVFIGPRELPAVIRGIAKAVRAMKGLSQEVKKTFDDLAEESGVKDDIKMIQGDDGQWYESYVIPAKRSASGDPESNHGQNEKPSTPAQGGGDV